MSETTRHVPDVQTRTLALAARALVESDVAPGALMIPRAEAIRAILWAMRCVVSLVVAASYLARHCHVCGCTQLRTCSPDDPCSWVAPDLCNHCEPYLRDALKEAGQ